MLIVAGGTVVGPEGAATADVAIESGRVARVAGSIEPAPGDEVVDARGKLIVRGGIDVHTHMDMPIGDDGIRVSDDFETGTVAAALGGTTTIVDYAAVERGEALERGLARWRARAEGRCAVDWGLHMTLTWLPADAEEAMGRLCAEGVTSFKLYMAYPERLMVDDATIFRALHAAGRLGALVAVHCENGGAIEVLREQAAGRRDARAHAETRPPQAEGEAVWRAAMLAEMAGSPVYAVHLSSSHALEQVRRARERGLPVFGETCPQYLWLDASLYDRDDGYRWVCSPPLRDRRHQEDLWEGLARGDLHAVATDHCPFWVADKAAAADFSRIPGGMPGVETRMSLVYQGVRDGRLTLGQWVDLCSTLPARLFGLWPPKGQLREGSDADVVMFDPEARHRLDAADLHMRVDDSPYEGRTVTGWPEKVWSRGRLVADGGRFVGERGAGRYLSRGLPDWGVGG